MAILMLMYRHAPLPVPCPPARRPGSSPDSLLRPESCAQCHRRTEPSSTWPRRLRSHTAHPFTRPNCLFRPLPCLHSTPGSARRRPWGSIMPCLRGSHPLYHPWKSVIQILSIFIRFKSFPVRKLPENLTRPCPHPRLHLFSHLSLFLHPCPPRAPPIPSTMSLAWDSAPPTSP